MRTGRSSSRTTISRPMKCTFPHDRTGGDSSINAVPALISRSISLCNSARCDSTDCKTNHSRAAARAASPCTRAVLPCAHVGAGISGVCDPQKTQTLTGPVAPLRAMSAWSPNRGPYRCPNEATRKNHGTFSGRTPEEDREDCTSEQKEVSSVCAQNENGITDQT